MTIHHACRRLLSATMLTAAVAAFASPALALDADSFAAKVTEVLAVSNQKLTYAAAELEGDTVTLVNARLSLPGTGEFGAGDLVFDGVAETADGGYTAETVSIDDVNATVEDTTVSMTGLEMSGLTIPAKPTLDSLTSMAFYDGFSMGPMTVTVKGEKVFSLAGAEGTVTRDGDAGMDFEMTANGILIDLSQVKEPKTRDALDKLGYQKLSGTLALDMGWEADSGLLDMREYALTLDDVGKLDMSFKITGYTLEFAKALQEAQAAAAANPDKKAADQAAGIAMLGMMSRLSFVDASIRFDDASLTSRALSFAGAQQGVSGEQMGQALKGMLPLMLGQLNMPALQQQISAAASTYLDNPQSLTISAAPAEPVGFPMIMGAGMGDPKQLVDLLGVTVSAND
ncbi:hypothetical protein DFR52_10167 [Hoeflea marina]|uniref:Uncharacterized protein n=1 Tax=Hoeflea marina TaxID=274592 RepID=A0A317PR19_9HYPH|nr:hypothetical protein [Hoeflea marina]PWW03387.1 hypothetical protein DFR52_10167 [Hoeflea marina]